MSRKKKNDTHVISPLVAIQTTEIEWDHKKNIMQKGRRGGPYCIQIFKRWAEDGEPGKKLEKERLDKKMSTKTNEGSIKKLTSLVLRPWLLK